MWLEADCSTVSCEQWESLMKGARPLNHEWLKKRIRKHLPTLYDKLGLEYPNPYAEHCKVTKTHYILVHSAIEYFIRKH